MNSNTTEVLNFINKKEYKAAILDQKWGVGKTNEIKKIIEILKEGNKELKFVYLTISDLKNSSIKEQCFLEQINDSIYLNKEEKDTSIKKGINTLKEMFDFISNGKGNIGIGQNILNKINQKLIKKTDLKNFVIFIDEIERIEDTIDIKAFFNEVFELKESEMDLSIILSLNSEGFNEKNKIIYNKWKEKISNIDLNLSFIGFDKILKDIKKNIKDELKLKDDIRINLEFLGDDKNIRYLQKLKDKIPELLKKTQENMNDDKMKNYDFLDDYIPFLNSLSLAIEEIVMNDYCKTQNYFCYLTPPLKNALSKKFNLKKLEKKFFIKSKEIFIEIFEEDFLTKIDNFRFPQQRIDKLPDVFQFSTFDFMIPNESEYGENSENFGKYQKILKTLKRFNIKKEINLEKEILNVISEKHLYININKNFENMLDCFFEKDINYLKRIYCFLFYKECFTGNIEILDYKYEYVEDNLELKFNKELSNILKKNNEIENSMYERNSGIDDKTIKLLKENEINISKWKLEDLILIHKIMHIEELGINESSLSFKFLITSQEDFHYKINFEYIFKEIIKHNIKNIEKMISLIKNGRKDLILGRLQTFWKSVEVDIAHAKNLGIEVNINKYFFDKKYLENKLVITKEQIKYDSIVYIYAFIRNHSLESKDTIDLIFEKKIKEYFDNDYSDWDNPIIIIKNIKDKEESPFLLGCDFEDECNDLLSKVVINYYNKKESEIVKEILEDLTKQRTNRYSTPLF